MRRGYIAGRIASAALTAAVCCLAVSFPAAAETTAQETAAQEPPGQEAVPEPSVQEAAQAAGGALTVEYGSLSQLVLNNQNLKSETEHYTTTVSNYQSLLTTLQEERDYMKFMAEKYEDDEEAEATYKSNASILSNTISQINKRLNAQYKKSGTKSVEEAVDSYTLTAQTLMNTYNQMALNVRVKEKSVQAAEASWQAAVNRQSSGLATAAEVMDASDKLTQERNLLTSYRQRASQARFALLSALGIEDSNQVTIGTIPEPDLTAIDGIDFEEDQITAVNNNAAVQSARHTQSGTYTENAVKSGKETEAEGNARASIQSAYQEILTAKLHYQAALDSFQSASIIYQSLQNKNRAGMLTQTEYLEGEADYQQALADKETASMNLYQAWEAYNWEVKGVSSN